MICLADFVPSTFDLRLPSSVLFYLRQCCVYLRQYSTVFTFDSTVFTYVSFVVTFITTVFTFVSILCLPSSGQHTCYDTAPNTSWRKSSTSWSDVTGKIFRILWLTRKFIKGVKKLSTPVTTEDWGSPSGQEYKTCPLEIRAECRTFLSTLSHV